jgi:hypothetical protein
MTTVEEMGRPRRGQRLRVAGQRLFGDIAGRYRTIKRRLAEMLMRGDRDYATLSALSQEIGGMRQKIRADLQRRREQRKRRSAANKVTLATLGGRRRQEP